MTDTHPTACEILRQVLAAERAALAQRTDLSRREAGRACGLAHYVGRIAERQQRELPALARLGREARCRLEPEPGSLARPPAPEAPLDAPEQEGRSLARDLAGARRVAAAVRQALFAAAGLGGRGGGVLWPLRPERPWCPTLRRPVAQAGENVERWQELLAHADTFGQGAGFLRAAAGWRAEDLGVLQEMAQQDCAGEVAADGPPARNGRPERPPDL